MHKGDPDLVSLILDFLADDMTETELLDQYLGLTHEGATFSPPMIASPMRCYCASTVSTTRSPSRSAAAASTT
jgi:hypothetical protein